MARRDSNRLHLLLGLAALVLPSPAGATPFEDLDAAAQITVLVRSGEIFDENVELDPDGEFAAAFLTAAGALGDGFVRLEMRGDPDPRLDYTLTLDNQSGTEVPVDLQIIMPMVPVGPGVSVSSSLDVTLSDPGGDGASLATFLPDIQQAFVSEDGALFTRLGVDLGGQLVVAPGASFSTGPLAGPAPDPAAGPAFTQLLLFTSFRLSPGDAATLEGSVVVVPEPGVLSLLLVGAAVLAGFRNPGRRHRPGLSRRARS